MHVEGTVPWPDDYRTIPHDAPREVIAAVGDRIDQHLHDVLGRWDISTDEGVEGMLEARARKFRQIGAWRDPRVASLDNAAADSQG